MCRSRSSVGTLVGRRRWWWWWRPVRERVVFLSAARLDKASPDRLDCPCCTSSSPSVRRTGLVVASERLDKVLVRGGGFLCLFALPFRFRFPFEFELGLADGALALEARDLVGSDGRRGLERTLVVRVAERESLACGVHRGRAGACPGLLQLARGVRRRSERCQLNVGQLESRVGLGRQSKLNRGVYGKARSRL